MVYSTPAIRYSNLWNISISQGQLDKSHLVKLTTWCKNLHWVTCSTAADSLSPTGYICIAAVELGPIAGLQKKLEKAGHGYRRCANQLAPACDGRELEFFFTFFHSQFCKNICSEKKLQNYTSSTMGDDSRDLPPCPTALGAVRYRSGS
jgi:hypothetical protein